MLEEAALALAALAVALALVALRRGRAKPQHDAAEEARAGLRALVAEETSAAAGELKSRLAQMRADAHSVLVV